VDEEEEEDDDDDDDDATHVLDEEGGIKADDSSLLNQAHFPTLESSLTVNDFTQQGIPFPLNSARPIPIETELFVGTLQLTLKPLEPSHDANFDSGRQPHFYFQLQGNVLQDIPLDQLYMGAQITRPMSGLGRIGKSICDLLLKLLSANIPGQMRYSFGGGEGEDSFPFISFPLSTAMDDLRVTDHDGQAEYYMTYRSDKVDLAGWKIRHPFDFKLKRIWGDGTPLQLIIYHQKTTSSPRTYLLQLQLQPREIQ